MKSDSDDSNHLPAVADLISALESLSDTPCASCSTRICGHEALMSWVMGSKATPLCLQCLARTVGSSPEAMRDRLYEHIQRRDCYQAGWAWSSRREGTERSQWPPCLWPSDLPPLQLVVSEVDPPAVPPPGRGEWDIQWDAGDLGCGDLTLQLKTRLGGLLPGQVLRVIARDPGAGEDVPAWCRLTGHGLVRADSPVFLIRKKEG